MNSNNTQFIILFYVEVMLKAPLRLYRVVSERQLRLIHNFLFLYS